MSPDAMLSYLGGVAEYAVIATAIVGLAVMLVRRRRPTLLFAILVLTTAFAIFLGLSPFPDPATAACIAPILNPLKAAVPYVTLWREGAPPSVWATNLGVITPVANVVLFAPVGLCLATQTPHLRVAVAYGLTVSGVIEISQLSGLYGVYACPYRTFDTMDLILNTAGIVGAFAMARQFGARPPAGDPVSRAKR